MVKHKYVYIVTKYNTYVYAHILANTVIGPEKTMCGEETQHILTKMDEENGTYLKTLKTRKDDVPICPDCIEGVKRELEKKYPYLKEWSK